MDIAKFISARKMQPLSFKKFKYCNSKATYYNIQSCKKQLDIFKLIIVIKKKFPFVITSIINIIYFYYHINYQFKTSVDKLHFQINTYYRIPTLYNNFYKLNHVALSNKSNVLKNVFYQQSYFLIKNFTKLENYKNIKLLKIHYYEILSTFPQKKIKVIEINTSNINGLIKIFYDFFKQNKNFIFDMSFNPQSIIKNRDKKKESCISITNKPPCDIDNIQLYGSFKSVLWVKKILDDDYSVKQHIKDPSSDDLVLSIKFKMNVEKIEYNIKEKIDFLLFHTFE